MGSIYDVIQFVVESGICNSIQWRGTQTVHCRGIASINPAGSRSTTVYNIAGQTIASVNAKGARSTTTYNADGQTVASINALGNRTTSIYDTGGRGVASVDAKGNRSTTVYDTKGRPAAIINPLGKRWSTIFNTLGQTVASKDPLGNRSTSVYDTAGRVVANINPLGKRATTVYNIASQSLATIDANGNRVSSVYDALGRRTVEVNALGNRTTTIYNSLGQTSALVDARANRHSFVYDSTGAQTQLIDPLNRRTTSAYDAAGQQSLRIDARGNRTSFVYSTVGQLTVRKYPNGSRATLSYDTIGNRTVMADSTGRYTATYDAVGQTTVTASPNSQRQTFSYDAGGQRRSMDTTGAGRFTYLYTSASQLSSLLNPYGERSTFSYDDGGRRIVQRNANGTRVPLSYDAASQTTQVFHRTSAGAAVLQLDYGYDPAGNRKSMAENGAAARTTWTYDKQNQLVGEYRTGTSPYRQTFTYDAAGNRTLKNVDTVRTTYAYDAANQLRYGQAVAGRTSFVYDATGNQRIEQPPTGNRTTTTWNYENEPTQYLLPAGSPVTMSYNGDNRLVISQQGTTSTKFVWDATTDAYLLELDGTNAVQAVYTNEPQQYGSVVSQRRGPTSNILHADALGTTRALTSSTQTTTDTYLLDAWGNPITSSGTTVNPFRWVGRYGFYTESSTGSVRGRSNIFQPSQGGWIHATSLPRKIATEFHTFGSAQYLEDQQTKNPQHNPFWTCETALMQLQDLRAEFKNLGFDLSVELLDLFLANKGRNCLPQPGVPYDMSHHCAKLRTNSTYKDALKNYVLSKVSDRTCKGAGQTWLKLPDFPVPNDQSLFAFELEWLDIWSLLRDGRDGKLDDLQDIQYAVGTGRFGYKDARIIVTPYNGPYGKECDCCTVDFVGTIILSDRFAFPNLIERKAGSVDYNAGAFLQKHCGYFPPWWEMRCEEGESLKKCDERTPALPPS